MTDAEYQALAQSVEKGEDIPLIDQYLFEQEQQRRQAKPNVLQQMAEARAKNRLLEPKKWSVA